MRLAVILPLVLGILWGAGASAPAQTVAGRAKIVDGDTLVIAGTTVRLLHIDAPESAQTCGRVACGVDATAHLARLVGTRNVDCWGTETDTYGRLLAVCLAHDLDLNRQMVLDGHAMVFRRYGDVYDAQERQARAARRGIWVTAHPTPPWDYRAARWRATATAAPRPDCPIKGNITAEGKRIYHTPFSRWYDRTRISPDKGERWFCTENDARAAGWRAAYGS